MSAEQPTENLVAMAHAAMRDERLSDGALYGKLADRIEALEAKLHEIGERARPDGPWEGHTPEYYVDTSISDG